MTDEPESLELRLSHILADILADQGCELDNLGDNESVIIMNTNELLALNLVEMSEAIIKRLNINEEKADAGRS